MLFERFGEPLPRHLHGGERRRIGRLALAGLPLGFCRGFESTDGGDQRV
jgi:hypothetical protein